MEQVEISPIVPPNRLRIFVASAGSMSPEGCSRGRVCSKLTRNRKSSSFIVQLARAPLVRLLRALRSLRISP
jgi:hypothetical protein